jgi:DNA-binding response OmpR family regulator
MRKPPYPKDFLPPPVGHLQRNTGKAKVIALRREIRSRSDGRMHVPGHKLTILVVEDHESLCEMLSLYLMRYGYHVRTATDGEIALSILSSEEIHLVLLDLMLPRIDGYGVLRWIRNRSNGEHPYVIAMSASNLLTERIIALQLGANEYLAKPFHLIRLLERIQQIEKTMKI